MAQLLADWVAPRAKDFEVIAQKQDIDAPLAGRALELVREFIIERRLILYGGQAIDFALRLKGSGIYPDHQTPDYDCFSAQNVDDAYELAERLEAAGFPHVGAIPAIHVQTMRVATSFLYVADISYAPSEVFDKLPTVSYAGMRVLHPDYQRTDMHLAFCFPFNNPPREDIFHRYRKDLARFRLLQTFYPITTGLAVAGGPARNNPPGLSSGPRGNIAAQGPASDGPPAGEIRFTADLSRVAIHGFAAYALMRRAFDELAATSGIPTDRLMAARKLADGPALGISFSGETAQTIIRFTPPAAAPRFAVATPWPDEIAATLSGDIKWFHPYMDLRPSMARSESGVEIHSTQHRLLGVWRAHFDGFKVTVATPQYVLLNFLYEAHATLDAGLRDLYIKYYVATLDLLDAGGALIAALQETPPAVSEELCQRLIIRSPFGLPIKTIGDQNYNASYLIRLARSAQSVGDVPPSICPNPARVPARYYPGKKHRAGERPVFDYANFQRAGAAV